MEKVRHIYTQTKFMKQLQNKEYRWLIIDFQRGSIKKSPIFVLSSVTYSIVLMYRGNDLVILFLMRRNPYGGYLSVAMKLLTFNETHIIDQNHREIVYPNITEIQRDRFEVVFRVTHVYPVSEYLYKSFDPKRKEIINFMSSLHMNLEFYDAIILFNNSTFPAHRVILASQSTIFKEICETREDEIPIKIHINDSETENDIFDIMLRYIYSSKLEITYDTDILNKLICVAVTYKVNNLINLCEHILLEHLNIETVIKSLLIADKFNFPDLEKYCFEFISENRKDICSRKEYTDIKENSRVVMKLINFILN